MKGEVIGMPKLQLLREFFSGLEGPCEVLKLDDKGKAERVERIKALSSVAVFEEYKPIIAGFIESAKVREVRRYRFGFEIVKYCVRTYYSDIKQWGNPYVLDVKYSPGGELISYTFDPNEETPIELSATLCYDDEIVETSSVKDIVDFCWNMGYNTGMFLGDENHSAEIQVWNLGSEESPCFDLEWMWGGHECLRMAAEVTSWGAMLDFVRRYIRGGLGEAQRGHEWVSVYARAAKCGGCDV